MNEALHAQGSGTRMLSLWSCSAMRGATRDALKEVMRGALSFNIPVLLGFIDVPQSMYSQNVQKFAELTPEYLDKLKVPPPIPPP